MNSEQNQEDCMQICFKPSPSSS